MRAIGNLGNVGAHSLQSLSGCGAAPMSHRQSHVDFRYRSTIGYLSVTRCIWGSPLSSLSVLDVQAKHTRCHLPLHLLAFPQTEVRAESRCLLDPAYRTNVGRTCFVRESAGQCSRSLFHQANCPTGEDRQTGAWIRFHTARLPWPDRSDCRVAPAPPSPPRCSSQRQRAPLAV